MQNLYIVKNITSGEVSDVNTFKLDAVVNGDNYSLIKKPLLSEAPEGDVVNILSPEEFKPVLDSFSFGG